MKKMITEYIQCPQCHSDDLVFSDKIICQSCHIEYPIVHGRPVLLRPNNDLFKIDEYLITSPTVTEKSKNIFSKFIPTPSVNLASTKILTQLSKLLSTFNSPKILVVGGGGQKKWLDEKLGVHKNNVRIIYSDIDVNAIVDLFCDGHDLPFKSNIFDAIITTAVLEHVLYPEKVASEIYRVLKVDGFLYSELPFMQQVHEGAYDFTRYTLSGHRRLFNGFSNIDSGMVAGPGTALVWAIENFALAFTTRPLSRKIVKMVTRLGFFWIKYFDYLLESRPEAMDGASCTYFLGRKKNKKTLDSDIIADYVGAKHLRHT